MRLQVIATVLGLIAYVQSFCPAFFHRDMEYDYCVNITIGLPQNKTVWVDDCEDGKVCTFGGRQNAFVWPITQADIITNSANYKIQYNNGGTPTPGFLLGQCKDPKELHKGKKLHGEKCYGNSDCQENNCNSTTHRCVGIAMGGACNTTSQCQSGYFCSASICAAVGIENSACTSDDHCPIDMICEHTGNTCQYLFEEVATVNVRDPRRCISGVKRGVPGANNQCGTVDSVQQNGVTLTDNV